MALSTTGRKDQLSSLSAFKGDSIEGLGTDCFMSLRRIVELNYVSAAGARLRIDASVNTMHFFNVLVGSDRTQEAGVGC